MNNDFVDDLGMSSVDTRTSTVHEFDYTSPICYHITAYFVTYPRTQLPCPDSCFHELAVLVQVRSAHARALPFKVRERCATGRLDYAQPALTY